MNRAEATAKIREIVGDRGDVQANRNWAFVYPNKQALVLPVSRELIAAGFATTLIDRRLERISIELP